MRLKLDADLCAGSAETNTTHDQISLCTLHIWQSEIQPAERTLDLFSSTDSQRYGDYTSGMASI